MKKMKFISMAAAMFAASVMLSSCWGGGSDDPVSPSGGSGSGSGAVPTVSAETYSIIASSNQPVDFSISVTAVTITKVNDYSATFSNISTANDVVTVTATLKNDAGFVTSSQTATINLSSDTPSANISFDFVEKSDDVKSQSEVLALASTDFVTIYSNYYNSSMTIQGGTSIVSGTSTEDFCISAYKAIPNTVTADDIAVGSPVTTDSKIMVLNCEPDGVTFSQPVTLRVNMGYEFANEPVTIKNGTDEVTVVVDDYGYAEFSVTHFSDWNVLFEPVVESIQTGSVTLLNVDSYQVAEGVNTYTFTKNVGTQFSPSGIIGMFVSKIFGNPYTTIVEEGSFMATAAGTASINVIQNYTDYVFSYGKDNNRTFSFRVWDSTVSTVAIGGNAGTNNNHSGGSGN